MNVNELRIAGHFEIPDARVDEEVDVALRIRVVGIERDTIDVSSAAGPATLEGGLRVNAVAVVGWPTPADLPERFYR